MRPIVLKWPTLEYQEEDVEGRKGNYCRYSNVNHKLVRLSVANPQEQCSNRAPYQNRCNGIEKFEEPLEHQPLRNLVKSITVAIDFCKWFSNTITRDAIKIKKQQGENVIYNKSCQ